MAYYYVRPEWDKKPYYDVFESGPTRLLVGFDGHISITLYNPDWWINRLIIGW